MLDLLLQIQRSLGFCSFIFCPSSLCFSDEPFFCPVCVLTDSSLCHIHFVVESVQWGLTFIYGGLLKMSIIIYFFPFWEFHFILLIYFSYLFRPSILPFVSGAALAAHSAVAALQSLSVNAASVSAQHPWIVFSCSCWDDPCYKWVFGCILSICIVLLWDPGSYFSLLQAVTQWRYSVQVDVKVGVQLPFDHTDASW